tara:strand:+ start:1016 stop:3196 length:2181 start_codon:yes stop_codon:yes gene_type:complete
MSIMNRKMFNRNARNKLNAMGGVASFQLGGSPSMKTNPAMVFGGTNMSDVQKLALRAYNQGIGSLSPLEQTFLAQRGATLAGRKNLPINLGADFVGRDSGIGKILGFGETVLGGARDVGTTALGTIGGGLASGLTSKPDASTLSGRIGMTRPSADAMSMFGFKQVPTTVDLGLQKAMQAQKIKPTIPTGEPSVAEEELGITGELTPTQVGAIDVTDADALNFAMRRDQDKKVQELAKDGQLVRYNEKTGKYEVEPRLPTDPSVAEEELGIAGELGEQDIRMTPGRAQAQFGSPVLPKPTSDADKKIIKPDEKTTTTTTKDKKDKKDEIVEPKPTSKEQVEKLITSGSEEEQQSELKQLMSEFKQNAPKYEGMDKNVALAKVFFSIAAGKDPDAITNIAQGLEKGADMFIKDKAKRDEFNRQVDLASLRYGLQERSKDRKLKYFIADKDVTVDGKKYEKGSVVDLSEGYIRKNGIPAGLTTETLTKAALDNAAAVKKALAKNAKDKKITNKDFIALGKQVTDATDTFTKSRNLQTLIQGQIFQVADGNVTGLAPAAQDVVNKAANAVGIDMGTEYESLERYNADMRKVANQLIKDLLGEGSKNISNVDRQLAQEIVGLFTTGSGGILGGYVFRDDDVLLSRLQGVHKTMQNTQQKSLAQIENILLATQGQTFQSGAPVQFAEIANLGIAGPGVKASAQGKGQKTIKLSEFFQGGKFDKDKLNKLLVG